MFAVGASLDFSDNFEWVGEEAEAWLELCASLCWLLDWVLYLMDQRQLDQHGEPRELPQIKKVGNGAAEEVAWVADVDVGGATHARRSKAIWMPELRQQSHMHRTVNW